VPTLETEDDGFDHEGQRDESGKIENRKDRAWHVLIQTSLREVLLTSKET
jgi:hypothetical protein